MKEVKYTFYSALYFILISVWFYRWMQDIGDLQWQVYEAIGLQSTRANYIVGRRIRIKK
jgi:hypothetical protein